MYDFTSQEQRKKKREEIEAARLKVGMRVEIIRVDKDGKVRRTGKSGVISAVGKTGRPDITLDNGEIVAGSDVLWRRVDRPAALERQVTPFTEWAWRDMA